MERSACRSSSQVLRASAVRDRYAGAITAGPLPAGLSFDPGTMTVSGIPLEGGGFHVDFRLTDDAGNAVESSTHFGIGLGPALRPDQRPLRVGSRDGHDRRVVLESVIGVLRVGRAYTWTLADGDPSCRLA